MSLIQCARHSIIFEHSYLVDEQVVEALVRASHRRVRVIVILPSRANWYHHANMQSVGRLLTDGHPLFMQALAHPTMVHAKTMLVDRSIAFLGSANSIKSSLDEIGEVNVLIEGKHREAIRRLREALREDIVRSRSLLSPPAVGWCTKWLAALGL
jgi:phosphatidylserine/phosphatidylglycerophosphate/cardiolipin synthase-like enzyme